VRLRSKALSAGKVLLLVSLLLVGLTVLGCVGIRTSPEGGSGGTIADGTIFLCPAIKQAGGFSCSAPVVTGKLVALDVSDGGRLWEAELEPSTQASGGFGCAASATPAAIYGNPVVAGELVYVGGYNGRVYAVNSSSGAVRWEYPRGAGSLQAIVGGVIAALDRLYFACSDGRVYALDAETGDLQPGFPFATGEKIWATPAIDGETLYVGSFDKKFYAIDAVTGQGKWEFETGGSIASTPLVYNDTVYFGSFDRYFYALDAATGSLKWKFLAEKWFWSRAVAYENTIYAGCLDGKVYVLDAETGNEVADAIDLGSPVYSWPVLVEDKVVIATEEGKVYLLDTTTNQLELLADLEETIYTPLCFSEGVVYVYSQAQNLYALNAASGASLWSQTIK
jgi:outer membrane protein assembly factor BamB